mmetsp:Transcript_27315/g.41537  ORF Transcript_27315/g.41537 Transcript_27315/m.41537 type:complete len:101 (+) Transcript_27315:850-1152(+)
MKDGKQAWRPIYVSLAFDILIGILTELKLYRSKKLRSIERRDLAGRLKSNFMKYLLRDPIFEKFTLPFLSKVFNYFWLTRIIFSLALNVINYYRYYTYIA